MMCTWPTVGSTVNLVESGSVESGGEQFEGEKSVEPESIGVSTEDLLPFVCKLC